MITSLTDAQTAMFPVYVDRWIKIGFNTDECDVPMATHWIKEAYKAADLPAPEHFIGPVNGPYEAAVCVNILTKFVADKVEFRDSAHLNELVLAQLEKELVIPQKINIDNQVYGNHEYWFSYIQFFKDEVKLPLEKATPLIELAKYIGWWVPLRNVAIMQHRPKAIHMDDRNRIHNINGPAIEFRSPAGVESKNNVYAIHGIRVKKSVIDRTYTVKDIESEANAEVVRVMMDLYGHDKFIVDSGTKEVASDDFGTLYIKPVQNDEPLAIVKVVNSTPEPDGTFKDYWIRVDPNAYGGLKTARAAVASTFRNPDGSLLFKSPEDYEPLVET